MLKRSEKGRLHIQSLDLQIFLGDLFVKCKDEEEINWLEDQLQEYVQCAAEERQECLEV